MAAEIAEVQNLHKVPFQTAPRRAKSETNPSSSLTMSKVLHKFNATVMQEIKDVFDLYEIKGQVPSRGARG